MAKLSKSTCSGLDPFNGNERQRNIFLAPLGKTAVAYKQKGSWLTI